MKTCLMLLACLSITSVYAADIQVNLGKQVYLSACQNCHAPQFKDSPLAAPTAFDAKAWQERFEQAKQQAKKSPERYQNASAYLLRQVKIGKGLMHHNGLCRESTNNNKNCSDEALTAAIHYMMNPKNAD